MAETKNKIEVPYITPPNPQISWNHCDNSTLKVKGLVLASPRISSRTC